MTLAESGKDASELGHWRSTKILRRLAAWRSPLLSRSLCAWTVKCISLRGYLVPEWEVPTI